MKQIFSSIPLLFLLIYSASPASANIELAKSKLNQGVTECKAGKYKQGINHIIDAAVEIRRSAPSSSLNSKWKRELKKCYLSQIKSLPCSRGNEIAHYQKLSQVYADSIMANKSIKRLLKRKIKRCFSRVIKFTNKYCSENLNAKDAVNFVKKISSLKTMPSETSKMKKAVLKCKKNIWKNLTKECSTGTSVKLIKKIIYLYKNIPDASKFKKEYSFCLKQQIEASRMKCVKEKKYTYGKNAMKYLYKYFKNLTPKDEVFNSKFPSMLQDCGIYKLMLNINMKGISGGIKFNLQTKGVFHIIKTKNGISTCAPLKFTEYKAKNSARCSISVTTRNISKTKNPVQSYICFTGKIKGRGSSEKLELNLDTTVARRIIVEDFQIKCPGKAPTVFSDNLFEKLLTKNFKLKILTRNNSVSRFRKTFDLGKGRKAIFTGIWKLKK